MKNFKHFFFGSLALLCLMFSLLVTKHRNAFQTLSYFLPELPDQSKEQNQPLNIINRTATAKINRGLASVEETESEKIKTLQPPTTTLKEEGHLKTQDPCVDQSPQRKIKIDQDEEQIAELLKPLQKFKKEEDKINQQLSKVPPQATQAPQATQQMLAPQVLYGPYDQFRQYQEYQRFMEYQQYLKFMQFQNQYSYAPQAAYNQLFAPQNVDIFHYVNKPVQHIPNPYERDGYYQSPFGQPFAQFAVNSFQSSISPTHPPYAQNAPYPWQPLYHQAPYQQPLPPAPAPGAVHENYGLHNYYHQRIQQTQARDAGFHW